MRDRVVLVTGAAGGIGSATCQRFCGDGARVVGVDHDEAALSRLCESMLQHSDRFRALQCDITDPDRVNNMFAEVRRTYGRLDVLVNNAGIAPKKDGRRIGFLDLTLTDWERVVAVNLTGAFLCSQAAASLMVPRRSGAIVMITSLARHMWTGAASAAYIASKAGMDGLTRALAIELIPFGVRVNAVAPGRVLTQLTTGFAPEVMDQFLDLIPVKRGARPDEIASVVEFLASDASSYIVGATMDVDGGRGIVSAPGDLLTGPRLSGARQ